jgi:hypothetical protein
MFSGASSTVGEEAAVVGARCDMFSCFDDAGVMDTVTIACALQTSVGRWMFRDAHHGT